MAIRDYAIGSDEEFSPRPNRPRVRQGLNYGDAPHLLHQMHRTELRGLTNRARLGEARRAGHAEMHGESWEQHKGVRKTAFLGETDVTRTRIDEKEFARPLKEEEN